MAVRNHDVSERYPKALTSLHQAMRMVNSEGGRGHLQEMLELMPEGLLRFHACECFIAHDAEELRQVLSAINVFGAEILIGNRRKGMLVAHLVTPEMYCPSVVPLTPPLASGRTRLGWHPVSCCLRRPCRCAG